MRAEQNKLIAVVQPHRYSRLRDLFSDFCACFNDADHVVVADVYAAGEDPIEGFEKEDLAEGLRAWGHRSVHVLSNPEALAEQIDRLASSGDLVMCLGAGTVTAWAAALPEQLAELRNTPLVTEADQ
jgi:UDP-N-acetylmuramate--alanine ligase